jgi:hypothetical protein
VREGNEGLLFFTARKGHGREGRLKECTLSKEAG